MNQIDDNDDPIYLSIVEQVKKIDTISLNDKVDQTPSMKEIEKQLVYIWLRLYIKDELTDIKEGDGINIQYLPTSEILESKFICYGKKNSIRDSEIEGDTLFKISRHFEFQVYRREELIFKNQRTEQVIEYIDCDF